uniref:TylF/MycF/NovP-related O-methyltransferase n=1 Tax=Vibrio alfacsensis TaxID=1074311 RepID=UPI001F4935A4|nr:TylF/MycF/NovP-related O-methyltransferase [Vibrio alfacsensis]
MRWATYRQLLENDYSRKIIGFDAFGAFPEVGLSEQSDVEFIDSFTMAGGDGLSLGESQAILEHKGFKNIELVEGNVFDSIPKYLSDRPETRVALLHLDMDVKEPTEFALEMLYDRVVPGGLIVVDDYNAVEGATLAVDSFLSKKRLKLEKLPYYNVPAFIRKPL